MKPASVKELKTALGARSHKELLELCSRLARFKKENKELLTYLLFESANEDGYVLSIKQEIDESFEAINTRSFFFIKKSVRKILRNIKKYARYSNRKETEVDLLLYFCEKLKEFRPSIKSNTTLYNLYQRQLDAIEKKIEKLPEDLQYDYGVELNNLL